jgi:hypothetical protein
MRVDGAFIELTAGNPEKLAAFYEGLANFERVASDARAVSLRLGTLSLAIRQGADPGADASDGGPTFGFLVTPEGSPDAVRDELTAGGAIVLSESKREGRRTFTCCDPVGYEFTVAVDVEALGQGSESTALVVASNSPADPSQPTPSMTNDKRSDAAPRPGARFSRRDLDRLRDTERLAQMQETIAGLHVGFGTSDPASVLDEMRAKVGPGFTQSEVDARDEQLRREQAAAEGDSLLERYKRDLLGRESEPNVANATSDPTVPRDDEEASVDVGRLRRSLGGSSDADE